MAVVTYFVQVTGEPTLVIDGGSGLVQTVTWPVKEIGFSPGIGPTSVIMNRPVSPPPSYADWGLPPWQDKGDTVHGDYHLYRQTARTFCDENHKLDATPVLPVTFEEGGVHVIEGVLTGTVLVVTRWFEMGHLKHLYENGLPVP